MTQIKKQTVHSKQLTIGWLYPEQMSTYGDRGNIIVLQKRSEWRGISIKIIKIDQNTSVSIFDKIDLLFGGGAQDREQKIVMKDLFSKRNGLKKLVDNNIPALFVCGSPQLLGKYYEPSVVTRIEGLGIFDMHSVHPGPDKDRLIGNIVAKVFNVSFLDTHHPSSISIVGFENHGGRTYLGPTAIPFAKVIKGFGNNGEDKTEGIVYKNAIGTYFHGPFLSKNPEIADWLIKTAIEIKYKIKVKLDKLDDKIENKAKFIIAKRLRIKL